jgi:hypothetical protein
MPLDVIAADFGGVARAHPVRHADSFLDRPEVVDIAGVH